jgi:hypothetical protein
VHPGDDEKNPAIGRMEKQQSPLVWLLRDEKVYPFGGLEERFG